MPGAVARAADQAVANGKQPTPAELRARDLRRTIDLYRPVIDRALPKHVTLERFVSSILTVCRSTPGLMACDPQSIVAGAIKAAQLGLEPDGEMCALVPRGGQATFQLMYKGGIQLVRNANGARRFVARTVYQGDSFDYAYGTADEHLVHKPTTADKRGPGVFWYAIAWDADGALIDFVVLTKADVEYHRGFSSNRNGPAWTKSYDAMARKTAVWELLRLLPKSAELTRAMAADGHALMLNTDALMAAGDDDDDREDIVVADAGEVTYEREHQDAIDTGEAQAAAGEEAS